MRPERCDTLPVPHLSREVESTELVTYSCEKITFKHALKHAILIKIDPWEVTCSYESWEHIQGYLDLPIQQFLTSAIIVGQ